MKVYVIFDNEYKECTICLSSKKKAEQYVKTNYPDNNNIQDGVDMGFPVIEIIEMKVS